MTTGGCLLPFVKFWIQSVCFFSEINPAPPYFLSLKILPMERSPGSQKNHRSDFELQQFLFWNSAHLGHSFRQTPKIIEFNRWSSLKNVRNSKLNHVYCVSQFLRENVIKYETKNVNKSSLLRSIFVIFLIFRPLELRK